LVAAKPALLAGGNPQIAKADGDAPVQAYIAAMPGWKRDVGRRLDALIVRTVPDVRKAVKWNSPFYGIEGQGWFLNFHCFAKYVKVAFFRGTSLRPLPRQVQAQGSALPRHPRGQPARRGAVGDLDPAGGRRARLGPVSASVTPCVARIHLHDGIAKHLRVLTDAVVPVTIVSNGGGSASSLRPVSLARPCEEGEAKRAFGAMMLMKEDRHRHHGAARRLSWTPRVAPAGT
jgi:hypothetical protein